MIVIKDENKIFSFRTAGIEIYNNSLLVHRTSDAYFWALPGGRVEMGETSSNTLAREMKEETGWPVKVGELVYTAENFFMHEGKDYHELGFYYRMKFDLDCPLLLKEEFEGIEENLYAGGVKLIFKWVPLKNLNELPLYPSFLKTGLQNLHPGIKHIVYYGD